MNPIIQGLSISVMGLLVTFLALGIFILVMILLKRIFPYKPEEEEEGEGEEEHPVVIDTAGGCDEMAVAAIAVAIIRERQKASGRIHSNALGASFKDGRGAWWSAGRTSSRQSSSLIKK